VQYLSSKHIAKTHIQLILLNFKYWHKTSNSYINLASRLAKTSEKEKAMYTLYQTLYLLWHLEVSSWDMDEKEKCHE